MSEEAEKYETGRKPPPEPEWTKEPPTEPGWYWWRKYPESEYEPAEVIGTKCWWRRSFEIRVGEGEWWPERIQDPQ